MSVLYNKAVYSGLYSVKQWPGDLCCSKKESFKILQSEIESGVRYFQIQIWIFVLMYLY
jgi:hypothetical protein